MGSIATTNRWHQAVCLQLTRLENAHGNAEQFLEESSGVLLFDQLLCAAVAELTGGDGRAAATIVGLFETLATDTAEGMSLKTLRRMLDEPGGALFEFTVARNQLLWRDNSGSQLSGQSAEQLILTTPVAESAYERHAYWLNEFESWLASAREFSQEY